MGELSEEIIWDTYSPVFMSDYSGGKIESFTPEN
jgi:hypothetical protein